MFKFLQDVTFSRNSVHFHKTGVDIPMDKAFVYQIWKIGSLHAAIRLRNPGRILKGRSRKKIMFFPQRAGPWYNARIAAEYAGLKITEDVHEADYHFVFSDDTISTVADDLPAKYREKSINSETVDISKGRVGEIFKDVFGYDVKVDPLTYSGLVVAKSEANGTHDGRVIECPITPDEVEPDCAYQKLVPTGSTEEHTEDLRLIYVMNAPAVVFHKTKDKRVRFGMDYLSVIPKDPEDVFSDDEVKLINAFCQKIGLDFGAIDILRSNEDGRIYIVDVNKTGMPVMCLRLGTQLKAFKKIADQFKVGLEQRYK